MARIPSLTRSLSSTVPLVRSVAERAVVTARPIVYGVVGRVAAHLPGGSRSTAARPAPETFAPSTVPEPVLEAVPEPVIEPVVESPVESVVETADESGTEAPPSPASIARNVAAPRPTAKSTADRKPRSAPGAKLPVRRASPST